MPAGELVTVPEPLPAFVTVSARGTMKVAVTVFATSFVTTHVVALPLHPPPLKPVKTDPAAATADRVTDAFFWLSVGVLG